MIIGIVDYLSYVTSEDGKNLNYNLFFYNFTNYVFSQDIKIRGNVISFTCSILIICAP